VTRAGGCAGAGRKSVLTGVRVDAEGLPGKQRGSVRSADAAGRRSPACSHAPYPPMRSDTSRNPDARITEAAIIDR
jgi:hypothetical protein